MTYDQCQAVLAELGRRQGTDRPLVRIIAGGLIVRGRVVRNMPGRPNPVSPYGLLVVEQPGLTPGPASMVQIASIPEDGLCGVDGS